MKITVIGSGYVGLVTGTCLAEMGNHVICVDVDEAKIQTLNSGGLPIFEPGLIELIQKNRAAGRLQFTTDVVEGVSHGILQFIAVGTPPDEDGSADLKFVLEAARTIGRHINEYKVIIGKSTVPVGTGDLVRVAVENELARRNVKADFAVISNPEFLKEGAAIEDFMRPDRIVIGGDDDRAISLLRELYAPFIRNHDRLLVMDLRSAEFTKYAANAMLATRISFMNELAALADTVGADIESVRKGIGSDPRIGYHFLYAGVGYGGSCFPKDVKALIASGRQMGIDLKILSAVEDTNARQKRILIDKIIHFFGNDLSDRTFALWGLAFKPNTDDMREAPSRIIIQELLERGATIRAYDPVAMIEAHRVMGDLPKMKFTVSSIQALQDADALIILTEWKEFKSPDFEVIKKNLKNYVIFDGRNIFDPYLMRSLGISYFSIGRNSTIEKSNGMQKTPLISTNPHIKQVEIQ